MCYSGLIPAICLYSDLIFSSIHQSLFIYQSSKISYYIICANPTSYSREKRLLIHDITASKVIPMLSYMNPRWTSLASRLLWINAELTFLLSPIISTRLSAVTACLPNTGQSVPWICNPSIFIIHKPVLSTSWIICQSLLRYTARVTISCIEIMHSVTSHLRGVWQKRWWGREKESEIMKNRLLIDFSFCLRRGQSFY